jgi:hypothetical protein
LAISQKKKHKIQPKPGHFGKNRRSHFRLKSGANPKKERNHFMLDGLFNWGDDLL